MSDREALAIFGLRKMVFDYGDKLHDLIERKASAKALHIVVANFEANCGYEATFDNLVAEGHGIRCHDCDVDVMPCDPEGCPIEGGWERYAVHKHIWNAANGEGWLCIECLEKRLGRTLTPEDFTGLIGLNEPSTLDSSRLRDRRGA
jgi:hypothetical protein